jgi:hypothetical protein
LVCVKVGEGVLDKLAAAKGVELVLSGVGKDGDEPSVLERFKANGDEYVIDDRLAAVVESGVRKANEPGVMIGHGWGSQETAL